jgi:CheY-like chemotaxis protein
MDPAIVMLIDDEPDVLTTLGELLEAEGFRVVMASDPEVLDQVVMTVRPDLFLVDVLMPGTTGVFLATRLRVHGFADTPMIAMSASPLMSRFAADSGLFQEAIDKPFAVEALLDRVRRYTALTPVVHST